MRGGLVDRGVRRTPAEIPWCMTRLTDAPRLAHPAARNELRGAVRQPDACPKSGRTPERDAPKPVCRRRSASLSGTWTRLDPAGGRWGPLNPVAGGESLV